MKINKALELTGAKGVLIDFFKNRASDDEVYPIVELGEILGRSINTLKDALRRISLSEGKIIVSSVLIDRKRVWGKPIAIRRYKALLKERVVTRR